MAAKTGVYSVNYVPVQSQALRIENDEVLSYTSEGDIFSLCLQLCILPS